MVQIYYATNGQMLLFMPLNCPESSKKVLNKFTKITEDRYSSWDNNFCWFLMGTPEPQVAMSKTK